jgi:hypothetical protein
MRKRSFWPMAASYDTFGGSKMFIHEIYDDSILSLYQKFPGTEIKTRNHQNVTDMTFEHFIMFLELLLGTDVRLRGPYVSE